MLPTERADLLNDRSNDFVGFFLHGIGDTGDVAEAERTWRAFQDELCASTDHLFPNVSIDLEELERWEHSRARDFDVTDEVPF